MSPTDRPDAGSAGRTAALSPEKRRLLEAWKGAATAPRPEAQGPPGEFDPDAPAGDPGHRGPVPASFGQERLWFLDRLAPGSAAYNLPAGLRLRGPLDVVALGRSLDEIARRHEALRTTLTFSNGRLSQIIGPAAPVDLPVIDLRGLPAEDRGPEAERLSAEEASRPFEQEVDRPLRARLLRLADEEHFLVLTVHHTAADGWSWGILARELGAFYGAFRDGRPSPLPEPAAQYRDFAAWQRRHLEGPRVASEMAYWRARLGGELPVLELPADRPRSPAQGLRGQTVCRRLPAALTRNLEALARAQGATLFMFLLAAFKILLFRYTGQTDIVVGSPVANRTRPEFESVVGFLVNTLPLRTDLAGNPSFSELVARVRETTLDAYDHQDLPFERLVSELTLSRDLAHQPVFQVMFVLQNAPVSELRLPGLEVETSVPPTGSAKFDLTLTAEPTRGGLELVAEYATELFDPERVLRLLAHLEVLLAAAVADPSARLADLPLLTPGELGQLRAWNETGQAYPGERKALSDLITDQAASTPGAVALTWEGGDLTYGDLLAAAGRVAASLRQLGVEPDTVVGVLAERCPEMIVALLGVILAGGAYLPLDPDHPPGRLAYQAADVGARVLVTVPRFREQAAAVLPAGCLVLVGGPAHGFGVRVEPAAEVSARPVPMARPTATRPGPDNLAYVIYTSGSTGQPKGVLLTQGGVVNRLLALQATRPLTAGDRYLQTTSFTFDISLYEIFWPLSAGARVVLAAAGGQRDPAYLARLIQEAGVTCAQFVPSAFEGFIDQPSAAACRTLANVFCLGEALPPELCRRFGTLGLAARLHNGYGPSEATVHVTAWTCPPGETPAVVPIGRPAPNVQAWVAGPGLNLAPVGVPGEILVGGVGLARAYAGRADVTAEAFIPDSFSGRPGSRLYRTGDLGRLLPSGDIEFLGRLDHQVKIRGFRVEPGEIEAALSEHPEVARAVVVARRDDPGGTRLVAYLVPKEGASVRPQDLRDHLRLRLPEYMIPAAYVSLGALPLSPNGKIDRRALPAPDGPRPEPDRPFVGPRTPAETALAGIWAELLGLDRVGVEDDFFELGGHSLLATQIIARVADLYGVTLPVATLFATPTVGGLAATLEVARGSQAAPAPDILRPEDVDGLSEAEVDALLAEIAAGEEDDQ